MTDLRLRDSKTTVAAASGLSTWALVVLLMAYLMVMMDNFIVNIALSTIQRELHLSTAALELVVAGYTITFTLFLVLGGRLGDTFGRRRLLAIGLIGFTLASFLCGIASGGTELVVYRLLQGVFAALLPTQALGTIQHATTEGRERSRALALYASIGGLALAVGQIIGGVLLQANIAGSTWRPLFFINIPIGIVAVIGLFAVPETKSTNPAPVDIRGTVLFGAALLALLVPINQGQALGWPWWIWACLAASPVLFWLVWRSSLGLERRGGVPLLPPSLLRLGVIRSGLMLCVPFFIGFASFMFVFALTAQSFLDLSPLDSAYAILPMAIAFFIGSLLAPKAWNRFGKVTLSAGAVIQAVGLALVAWPMAVEWPGVTIWHLAPGLALAGFGQSMIFGGLFRTIMGAVPVHQAGVGSGVLVTTQQASLATGVAVLGTLFASLATSHGGGSAFAVVVAIQAVLALAIAVGARALRG